MKIPASFILTSRNVNWLIGSWVCPNVSTCFRFGGKCFILNVFKSFCKCSSFLCIQSPSFIIRKTLCKIDVFDKYILHKVFSKYRPSELMLSISRNVRRSVGRSVCLSVCPCVCLFTFEVPFNGYQVFNGCQIFLEIRNPWGKVMERSGLTFEHFRLKMV